MSENPNEQLISTPTPTNSSHASEADNGDPEKQPGKDASQPELEANSSDQRDPRREQDLDPAVLPKEEGGRRATGPRTPEGKGRSSQNSRKHGLFARELYFNNEEEREQFNELLEELRQDLKPRGAMQEWVVSQIARCVWGLQWLQKRIAVEFNKRESANWATTLREFMGKSNALALPLPSDPESHSGEHWVPWHAKEVSLKLVGGDHNVENTHEVSGNDLTYYKDTKDKRAKTDTVQRFELEMRLGDSLETFRRYEAGLKRELLQYLECLERLQRRKPAHND